MGLFISTSSLGIEAVDAVLPRHHAFVAFACRLLDELCPGNQGDQFLARGLARAAMTDDVTIAHDPDLVRSRIT